jgi:hypothetical protein
MYHSVHLKGISMRIKDHQMHVFKMCLSVDIRLPKCFDRSHDHHQGNFQGY